MLKAVLKSVILTEVGSVQPLICLTVSSIHRFRTTVFSSGGSPLASVFGNEIFSSHKDAKHSGTHASEMPQFDG